LGHKLLMKLHIIAAVTIETLMITGLIYFFLFAERTGCPCIYN